MSAHVLFNLLNKLRLRDKIQGSNEHFITFLWHFGKFNTKLTLTFFCCLMITFANSLAPDQDRQNLGAYLDPNCLASVPELECFEKVHLEKSQQTTKKHEKVPSMESVNSVSVIS